MFYLDLKTSRIGGAPEEIRRHASDVDNVGRRFGCSGSEDLRRRRSKEGVDDMRPAYRGSAVTFGDSIVDDDGPNDT